MTAPLAPAQSAPGTSPQTPWKAPFAGYATRSAGYDELCSAGQLRPHWQAFAAALAPIGPAEFERRWELAQRQVRDSAPQDHDGDHDDDRRLPELDPLPLLIPPDETRLLADGLAQRARLLDQVLADLYGPQRLLQRGLLPPSLVFGNPSFLHPCHGYRPPDDRFLQLYAADLGRGPDGRWRVLADRTDAPAGLGYALETRVLVSGMLPAVFRQCHVERLAPFFIALRETLRRQAPRHRDNPRVVLLTKGPASKYYVEDAQLARYLGYTLVDGADLTARGDRVLLKTLGGLLEVDVILRQQGDDDCDPLELRSDSAQGVAGLLQVVRAGNVLLANALGSALAQAPALLALLPRLAREWFGEALLLPTVESYWCGDPQACSFVLERLGDLVLRPAHRWGKPIDGAELSAAQLEAWRARIAARPEHYAAQEALRPACAPSWQGGQVKAAHVGLRGFAVAGPTAYEPLLGGLGRVADHPSAIECSRVITERRKDVWMLAAETVREVSLLTPIGQAVQLKRGGAELPSRVGDNLFWLGRQIERAEGAARLLRTTLGQLDGELELRATAELQALWRGLVAQGQVEPADPAAALETAGLDQRLAASIFDPTRPSSLRATISEVHRLASIVRDRISLDSWRIINRIDRDFLPPADAVDGFALMELRALLDQLLINLAAFAGMMTESMTRALGWRFLDFGRRIERALNMLVLLDEVLLQHDDPTDAAVLNALLEVADSAMTYRSRYRASVRLAPVVDLLLTDEQNPRSVAFQLIAAANHVEQLPRDRPQAFRDADERLALTLLHELRLVDVLAMAGAAASTEDRQRLRELLQHLAELLPALSDAVVQRYLVHAAPAHQLAEIQPMTLSSPELGARR
ncbi:MAG: circularly permuted type 2 ATP-grasp protein [Proteobacteria bacterium]|nr:circularly permuted type 2 ATP-grasp protein [Pseudomonadota bacterium]